MVLALVEDLWSNLAKLAADSWLKTRFLVAVCSAYSLSMQVVALYWTRTSTPDQDAARTPVY